MELWTLFLKTTSSSLYIVVKIAKYALLTSYSLALLITSRQIGIETQLGYKFFFFSESRSPIEAAEGLRKYPLVVAEVRKNKKMTLGHNK